MSAAKLKEATRVAKRIQNLNKYGFFGWMPYNPSVQMKKEAFLELFPEYDVEERGKSEWPYVIHAENEGVRFECLLKQEEYDELGLN